MDRAIQFFNHVFGWELKIQQLGLLELAWFSSDEEAIGTSG